MASSGTIKSWVLNTGTISGNSCAGAYYSFEWTSSKKSAGVTTVSWNLYGRGRTSSPTKLENEIYLDVVKNGATTRLYTLSDSNGTEQTSFKNYLRASGSFDVTHSNGAGSFTINMKVAIYTGSYHSTSEAATLDANYHNYTVSYNANGGSGAPSAQTKVHDTNLTLSSTKPTIGDTVTYPTGTITISYNLNGASGTAPSAGTGTYTNTKSQPRTFNVWNTNSSGTGTSYSAGGTYSSNASVTLYAQYKNKGSATETRKTNPSIKTASAITRSNSSVTGYKVTFNSNGSSATAPTAITSTKTRKYTFGGWNTNTSGTGTNYSAATSYTFSASDTLYAKWTSSDTGNAITLPAAITRSNSSVTGPTVSFNSNGSSVTAPTAIASTKTRKYTFGGWNTNTSGTGTNYAASSSYTPSAAVTLYAKWTTSDTQNAITLPAAITRPNGSAETGYKVTFNSNGSSATAPSAITSTKTPKYAFAGWNTAADGSGTNYSAGGSYTPSGAITLYAKWTKTYQNNAITLPSAITRSNSSVTGYKVTFNVPSTATSPEPITSTKTRKYTFGGWNTNTSGTGTNYAAGASCTPSAATTLYAKWTSSDTANAITLPAAPTRPSVSATPYTVTLNANGGSCSTASLSAARTTSYTFNKWNTASDGSGTGYSAGASYTPSGATTLYSTWNSSTSTASVTLPSASRTGYTFKGWSTSSTATSGSTGSYTPSGNVTLYATWSRNVSITTQPSNVTVTVGQDASTTVTCVGAGLTYQWYYKDVGQSSFSKSSITTSTYTTTMNTATRMGRQVYCVIADSNGNSVTSNTVTLNATYSIVYNANGGSGTMSNSTHTCRTAKALTTNAFTRDGYTFLGWSTSSSATSATYSNGQSVTDLTYTSATVTLYAVWIPQYIIQFNGNGNTGGTVPSAIKKDGTSTSTVMGGISSSYPTRTGYKFRGWSASSSYSTSRIAYTSGEAYGGGPDYNGTSATVTSSTWTYANYCSYTGGSTSSTTLTLYAQWEKIQYSVTYNANGGNTSSIPANQTKIYGTALPLSTVIPTKSDDNEQLNFRLNFNGASETSTPNISKTIRYTFTGWNTKADGSGTNYAAGSSYSSNAAVTLYAQWSYSESVSPVTLPSPTRTGYTFNGWNGAEIDSAFIDRYTGTLRDVQIYWKSYIDDEGDWTYSDESIGSQGVPYLYWTDVHPQSGMYVPVIQLKTIDPESEYYHELDEGDCYYYYGKHVVDGATYDCWQKQEGEYSDVQLQGLTRVCIYTNVIVVDYTDKKGSFTCHNSIELIARWTANIYTIRYVSTYGSGSTASSSHTYNVSKALATNGFSRTGYTFLGWSTSSTATTATYTNGQSVKNLTATPNGTVTLYAVWQLSATWSVSVTDNNGNALQEPVAFGTPVKLNITCNPDNTFEFYEIQVRIDSDLVAVLDANSTGSNSITLDNSWLGSCSLQQSSYVVHFYVFAHEFDGNVAGVKVKSISTSLTKAFAPDVSATTEIIDLTGICPGKELGRYTQLLITPTVACKYGSTIKNFLIKDPAGVVVVNSNNSSSYTTVSLDIGAFPGCYNESNPSLSWTITVTDTRDQTTTFTITQPVKHNIPSNVHAYVPYIWSGSAWVKYTPEIASSSTITSSDIYVPFIKD